MNASKTVWVWSLTLRLEIFKNHLQFTNMSKMKSMGVIWALDAIKAINLRSNLCT